MQKPILLYQTADSNINVEVTYIDESFWLNQKAIAQLFGVESNTVTYHLKEIFKSEELEPISTTRKIRVLQKEGNREIDFYNLDVIIAIGFKLSVFKTWVRKNITFEFCRRIYFCK